MQEVLPTHALKISGSKNKVFISCECRARVGTHSKANTWYCDPMGTSKNFEETVQLYNNPDNHWAPFEKKDEIGGKSKSRFPRST